MQELEGLTAAELAAATKDSKQTERLLKHRRLQVLRQKAEHKRDNGIFYYKPHPKQDLFHRAGNFSRRYVRCGNRWGKTTAGTAEDIAFCRGERTWIPEGDPARTAGIPRKSVKMVLIVQDWEKSEEIFTSQAEGEQRGKIFKLLPTEWFGGVEKNGNGNICKILIKSIHGGMSALYIDTIKSFMGNPQGHESSDWDGVHVDEPLPEAMWEAYARGLMDRGGKAWFLCTPICEMWINDYFFPEGRIRSAFDEGLEQPEKSMWVITGSTYDNTTLDEKDIESFKRDIPKANWEARISGKPKALSGTIYPQFDDSVHLYNKVPFGWQDYGTPPLNYTIRVSIDPHPITPHAVLFAATSPFGVTYFYREIFDHCLSDLLAKQILYVLKGRLPYTAICDPLGFIEHPTDGRCMVDDFRLNQLHVEPASKDLTRGILAVQNALEGRDRNGNPTLMFSRELTETIREFDRYVFDPKTGKPHTKAPDHMMENLYRLVLGGLDYIPPEKQYGTRRVPLPNLSSKSARNAMDIVRQQSKYLTHGRRN